MVSCSRLGSELPTLTSAMSSNVLTIDFGVEDVVGVEFVVVEILVVIAVEDVVVVVLVVEVLVGADSEVVIGVFMVVTVEVE